MTAGYDLAAMTQHSDFLDIDGVRLECRWIGPAPDETPTLVFLHEGLGCVGLWKDFPDRLVERTGFGGFVYSRAGFGRSDARTLPLPVDYHRGEALEVLPKVLAAKRVRRAILIGHSDGGTISLMFVGSGRSSGVLAIISMAAHVFNEPVTIKGIREARTAYRSTTIRDKLARHHGSNVDGAFWGWNDVWLSPEFAGWNVEGCLPGITVPVLVIQGIDDHYGTAAQVEAIAAGVSGRAETLLLPGCGHSPHLEQPEEVLDAMTKFIAGLGC